MLDRIQSVIKDQVPQGADVDERRRTRYDVKDLMHWWNQGQIRLSTMVPRHRHWLYDVSPFAGRAYSVDLPEDFFREIVICIDQKEGLPMLDERQFHSARQPGYLIYDNKIYVLPECDGKKLLLVYHSYYPDITSEQDKIIIPRWAVEACQIYVAMQVATKESIADARFRKLTGKYDVPGTPINNPFLPVAKFLEQRFFDIIRAHADDHGHRNT